MKKLRLSVVLGMALLVGGAHPLFAQSKKERQAQKAGEVKELLESGAFTIDVNRALPMGGKAVNLTSPYSLELKGDSVFSYLPYFGRAYNVPYGGGEGLRFNESVTENDITYDKKGNATIRFKARTNEDNFTFDIKVFTNGSATINVQPVNRQSISYYGELAPVKDKKDTDK